MRYQIRSLDYCSCSGDRTEISRCYLGNETEHLPVDLSLKVAKIQIFRLSKRSKENLSSVLFLNMHLKFKKYSH
jgi:hypothetical protein